MDRMKIKEKLNSIRGSIISDATNVEVGLGYRLTDYFFPKSSQKSSDLYWYIINTNHFNFDKKISLYEQIPYFKRLKRYPKVKKSLRCIQKVRNALAHGELDEKNSKENEIIIYNPISYKEFKINDKLIKEFKEHVKFLKNIWYFQ